MAYNRGDDDHDYHNNQEDQGDQDAEDDLVDLLDLDDLDDNDVEVGECNEEGAGRVMWNFDSMQYTYGGQLET